MGAHALAARREGCVMAAPATGSVVVDTRRKSPVYGLRFRVDGRRHYVTLGTADAGWDRKKAQEELETILAKVKLGVWKPPEPEPAPVVERDPTFHEFASDWFEANEGRMAGEHAAGLRMAALEHHLLTFFRYHRLSQITIAEVDRYRTAKVKQGKRRATSINKTITRLGADPRGRRRVRADRAQPGPGQAPAGEGGEARAGVAGLGRAHRRAAGRGRRARPRGARRPARCRGGRSSRRWCSPACGSGS